MHWSRDWKLRVRMVAVLSAMALLYAAFAVALTTYFGTTALVVGVLGVVVLGQLLWGHRVALKSVGADVVSEQSHPGLHARVDRLAQQAGVPKPKVAVAETAMPNAFAIGRSQRSAVVCVTTGLLESLDDDELDGVLAHELAHVEHHDMVVMTVAATLSAMSFYVVRWGFIYDSDKTEQYTLMAVLASLGVWIASIFVGRLLSRYREFAADRGAVSITGNPAALASALRVVDGRMDEVPDDDLREHAGMNALFFRDVPQTFGVWSWEFDLTNWLRTHPAVDRRIERLQALEVEMATN